MRAFVTGASGFVGTRLVDRLLAGGWDVRAFQRGPGPVGRPGLETIRGDIRDEALVASSMAGADLAIHLAAALGSSRLGEKDFLAVNAGGTKIVLEAALKAGLKRTVHFSSAGVLGHVEGNEPADEDHPMNPRDAYDRTKLAGERIALDLASRGLDVVIIRPGWVYGPGDKRTFKLIRAIAGGRFILAGRGEARQTPVHVDDLVEGVLLAAEKGRGGEIYNLAGRETLTVRAMAETIASACGKRIPRLRLPLGPTRLAAGLLGGAFGLFGREAPLNPSRLAFFLHPKPLRIAKARAELGYDPTINFSDGIAGTVAWARKNGWL